MDIAYRAVTILLAAMVLWSGIAKLRHDPNVVRVIHEVVGVPLSCMPLLAVCEVAGASGIVLGILWSPLGIAAGMGLVLYFLGAPIPICAWATSKRSGPAAFLLVLAAAALTLSILTSRASGAKSPLPRRRKAAASKSKG
jgi:hypothetical protein